MPKTKFSKLLRLALMPAFALGVSVSTQAQTSATDNTRKPASTASAAAAAV